MPIASSKQKDEHKNILGELKCLELKIMFQDEYTLRCYNKPGSLYYIRPKTLFWVRRRWLDFLLPNSTVERTGKYDLKDTILNSTLKK